MFEYLLEPYNTPFFYALLVMLFILGLEVLSLLMGAGLSEIIDNLFDATDIGIGDADAELEGSFISKYIAWIKVKNVPLLILFVIYLGCFAIVGYVGQNFLVRVFEYNLPNWLASVIAVIVAFPFYKMISGYLGKKVFKEETSAISEKTFIGKTIEINTGVARKGLPAEGKYKDHFGQLHYFLVEPENEEEIFEAGTQVELISLSNSVFKAKKANT